MYSYTVQTGPRSPTGSVWVLYRYTPIVSWRHRSMFVFCWWLVKFAFLTNFIIISWVELKVWNALSLIAILVWKPVINIIIILNDFTNRRYPLLLLFYHIFQYLFLVGHSLSGRLFSVPSHVSICSESDEVWGKCAVQNISVGIGVKMVHSTTYIFCTIDIRVFWAFQNHIIYD